MIHDISVKNNSFKISKYVFYFNIFSSALQNYANCSLISLNVETFYKNKEKVIVYHYLWIPTVTILLLLPVFLTDIYFLNDKKVCVEKHIISCLDIYLLEFTQAENSTNITAKYIMFDISRKYTFSVDRSFLLKITIEQGKRTHWEFYMSHIKMCHNLK